MLGCLFFVFGLVSWVNSILVPYFKVACDLQSEVQGYLAQFAFYIAYLVMTIPASALLGRTGYKKGALIGLDSGAVRKCGFPADLCGYCRCFRLPSHGILDIDPRGGIHDFLRLRRA